MFFSRGPLFVGGSSASGRRRFPEQHGPQPRENSASITTRRTGNRIARAIPAGTGSASPISRLDRLGELGRMRGGHDHAPRPRPPPQLAPQPPAAPPPCAGRSPTRRRRHRSRMQSRVSSSVHDEPGDHRAQGFPAVLAEHVRDPPEVARIPHVHRARNRLDGRAGMEAASGQVGGHDVVLVGRGDRSARGTFRARDARSAPPRGDRSFPKGPRIPAPDSAPSAPARPTRAGYWKVWGMRRPMLIELADVSDRRAARTGVGEGAADEALAVVEGAAHGHRRRRCRPRSRTGPPGGR